MGWFKGRLLPFVLLLLSLGGRYAFAAQATLIADAHVNSALPVVNSGTISNLNVGAGYTALLQFDLGTLPSTTTSAQISKAILRVYCNRADTPGLVSVQPVQAAWGEYSITYATLPSLGSAVQVASVAQAGSYVVFDVTALLQSWVSAPVTNFGVALTAGTAAVQFDSKENDLTGHAAELEITLVSQGPPGPQGLPGATGAAGPQGATGPQGLLGPQGLKGAIGASGPAGPQGIAGATGAQGNAGLTGPPGSPGPTGATGPTGIAGPAGAKGAPGLVYQGTYNSVTNYALGDVVLWQGASYASLADSNHGNTPSFSPAQWGVLTAQGPAGPTGAKGDAGAPGPQGLPGSVGPNGPPGPQGVQGIAGQAGALGLTGPQGATGLSGPMGPQGVPGPVGMTFRGAYDSIVNYALADGVTYNGAAYVSLAASNHGNTPDQSPSQWALFATGGIGPAGPAGAAGLQGPPGPNGPQGLQGLAGAAGATGPQGPAVANYLGDYVSSTNYGLHDAVSFGGSTYVSLTAANLGQTPGASPSSWALLAAQGPAGPAGLPGAPGAAGPAGPAGATGASGPQGPPVTFAGGWLIGTAYATGDIVGYAGSSYVALVANTGRQPDASPVYWGVLAQAGLAGAAGPEGLQGATGYAGTNGAQGATGPAGATGPTGAAATVTIGSVTTGLFGTQAAVVNSGTASAAVLNFTIPQGAAGANGSGSGTGTGSGSGGGASASTFLSTYHAVSFSTNFYSVNSPNASASESAAVLTWAPATCTAASLTVYSQQSNTVTVTLRNGTPGSMSDTALACSAASGGSCTVTGSIPVAAGSFLDLSIAGANGTQAGVWTALGCS